MSEPHAYLFVDGSCGANDDLGGWAAIAVSRSGERKLLTGMACPTTISRCELMPIIEGVQWIHKNWSKRVPDFRLQVYSDSDYTVKTLNGIYTVNKNRDLWAAALDFMRLPIHFTFSWVSRNTLPYMELCDGIAGAMRQHNVALAPQLFHGFDHRRAIEALPVEPLPTVEPPTIIPREISCLSQHHGESSIPPTSNSDTSSMDSPTD
jgi:ribonuclease HI